ncbi:MAG: hypothetical protein ABI863_22255 [Ginsengibacter sp.]
MTITNKPNWLLAIGLPFCIFLACFFITLSSAFKLNADLLSNAIVIDLLITAPVVYFFAIRKSRVSKLSVARVFIVGLLIAPLILSAHSNAFLHFIKIWVSPLIEGTVIFIIGRKFYVANKKTGQPGTNSADFLLHCRMVMHQVVGNQKAGNIISSEIAVLYYAFMGRKDKTIDYQSKFTSYKENGIILVLGTFLSLFLIETTGTHFLLNLWNPKVAWTLSVLSFYTCIQLYAHIKAIKARPIILGVDSLGIHNGLAGDAVIEYNNIEKVELSKKIPIGRESIKIALIKGLENHNCVIYLKQPIQVTKIFGIKKTTDTILFFVDRPKDFVAALKLKLINSAS